MAKKISMLVLTLLLVGCTNTHSQSQVKSVGVDENWRESEAPYSDSVVCTLKASAVASFEEGNLLQTKANIDERFTTLTFIDLNNEEPSMVGNLGDKAELLKIDYGSQVYLIENTGFGNMNVFTLFRDKNIMLMSKQYDLLGKPFGLMMIGDCLSGA